MCQLDRLTSQGYRVTLSDIGGVKLLTISRPGSALRCADGTESYCLHITAATVEAAATRAAETLGEVSHASHRA